MRWTQNMNSKTIVIILGSANTGIILTYTLPLGKY